MPSRKNPSRKNPAAEILTAAMSVAQISRFPLATLKLQLDHYHLPYGGVKKVVAKRLFDHLQSCRESSNDEESESSNDEESESSNDEESESSNDEESESSNDEESESSNDEESESSNDEESESSNDEESESSNDEESESSNDEETDDNSSDANASSGGGEEVEEANTGSDAAAEVDTHSSPTQTPFPMPRDRLSRRPYGPSCETRVVTIGDTTLSHHHRAIRPDPLANGEWLITVSTRGVAAPSENIARQAPPPPPPVPLPVVAPVHPAPAPLPQTSHRMTGGSIAPAVIAIAAESLATPLAVAGAIAMAGARTLTFLFHFSACPFDEGWYGVLLT